MGQQLSVSACHRRLKTGFKTICQCTKCSDRVSLKRRTMHKGKRGWSYLRKLPYVGCGRGAEAGQLKEVLRLHCRADDVVLGHGWAATKSCKEVAAEKGGSGLFEHHASIPSMRDVGSINITNSLAPKIDNLAISEHTRWPVRHVSNGHSTPDRAMHHLCMRGSSKPFIH